MSELDLALTRPERVDVDNPISGDLFVDPITGDLLTLDNVDTEVQAIQIRCLTLRGEVYTDADQGLPMFEYILGNKQANPSVIKGFYRAAIEARGSVKEITKLEHTLDGATRALTISFEGVLADGQIIGADYTQGLVP